MSNYHATYFSTFLYKLFYFSFIILLLSFIQPTKQVNSQERNTGISQVWSGSDRNGRGDVFYFTIRLEITGSTISGTHLWISNSQVKTAGTIIGLTVGPQIEFDRRDTNSSYAASFIGNFTNNSLTMSGEWTDSNGDSGTWEANKVIEDAITFSRSWSGFTQTSSGQKFFFSWHTTRNSSEITGLYYQGSQILATITGMLDGRMILVTRKDNGTSYQAAFVGLLRSDDTAMTGTWTDTNGGSGIWNASAITQLYLPFLSR